MTDDELLSAIESAFDEFLHQEGARQRGWDYAEYLMKQLSEAGWRIERTDQPDSYPYTVESCRSCQAPIIWAVTMAGKTMPIDSVPVSDGGVLLEPRSGGKPPFAHVLSVAQRFGRTGLRASHFATCPHAGQVAARQGGGPMTLQDLLDMANARGIHPGRVAIAIGGAFEDDEGGWCAIDTDEPVACWDFKRGERLLLETKW